MKAHLEFNSKIIKKLHSESIFKVAGLGTDPDSIMSSPFNIIACCMEAYHKVQVVQNYGFVTDYVLWAIKSYRTKVGGSTITQERQIRAISAGSERKVLVRIGNKWNKTFRELICKTILCQVIICLYFGTFQTMK